MSTTVNALVEVCDAGADDEELAEAARRLRAELLELDVTGAEPAPAPAGRPFRADDLVATPLPANGRVYAGTRGGHVYAVRVMTGTLIRR